MNGTVRQPPAMGISAPLPLQCPVAATWTAPQKLDTQLSKVQFLWAKPKYSPETKLAVVNHYLSGKDGEQDSTADLFGIERTSVRRWVRAWQFHGAEGLTAKNNHYSDEFKLVVVRAVISDRLTMREAAARFNLSAEILVRRWLDVYNDAGAGMLFKHAMRTARTNDKAKKYPTTDR